MRNQIQNPNRKKKKTGLGSWRREQLPLQDVREEALRFPLLPTYLLLDLEAGFSLEESSHTKVKPGLHNKRD